MYADQSELYAVLSRARLTKIKFYWKTAKSVSGNGLQEIWGFGKVEVQACIGGLISR